MAQIHTEEVNGIVTRYVKAQNNMRVYLLPNVPANAGKVPIEGGFDLEGAVKKFPKEFQERVERIGEQYKGRQLDTTSVLLYANEQGKFEEYAKRLESNEDFRTIHPDQMMARTDVNTFFIRLYADLGIAPVEEAERAEKQLRDYGAGLIILPND